MNSAKDYYFYTGDSSNLDKEYYKINSVTTIVSIEFWNKNKHCEDKYLLRSIESFLPLGLTEESRSHFASHSNPEEVKAAMLAAGFVESQEYTDFALSHDPFIGLEADNESYEDFENEST